MPRLVGHTSERIVGGAELNSAAARSISWIEEFSHNNRAHKDRHDLTSRLEMRPLGRRS
jgi:hypothetical protein